MILLPTILLWLAIPSTLDPPQCEGGQDPSCDDILKVIGSNADSKTRLKAIRCLQMLRVVPKATPSALIESLTDPDVDIRTASAAALARFSDSRAVLALCKAAEKDSQWAVRKATLLSLSEIGTPAADAIPCLMRLMNEKRDWKKIDLLFFLSYNDESPNCYAAKALISIGKDSVLPLAQLAANRKIDLPVRQLAIRSLSAIGVTLDTSTRILVDLTTDVNETIRIEAIEYLVTLHTPPPLVKRAFYASLADESQYVRVVASVAIQAMDSENPVTVPVLAKALHCDDIDVQWRAVTELGLLGDKAKTATQDICQLLDSEVGTIREAAAVALGRIGPSAKMAIPRLMKMSNDKSLDVRDAAKEAIERIRGK